MEFQAGQGGGGGSGGESVQLGQGGLWKLSRELSGWSGKARGQEGALGCM